MKYRILMNMYKEWAHHNLTYDTPTSKEKTDASNLRN